MTNIPEWAKIEAREIVAQRFASDSITVSAILRGALDAYEPDILAIARALAATAARVERETREADAALAKSAWLTVALEMDMDADRAESLCHLTSEAIRALPLKYGERK